MVEITKAIRRTTIAAAETNPMEGPEEVAKSYRYDPTISVDPPGPPCVENQTTSRARNEPSRRERIIVLHVADIIG
jgi:hypothetical protein